MHAITGRTSRPWTMRIALIILSLASLLEVCHGATFPTPTARTLMLIAFPDWNPSPPKGPYAPPRSVERELHVTRSQIHHAFGPGFTTIKPKYKFDISPLLAASFDDSHAILLTIESVYPDSMGIRCDYSCPLATGAYFFTAGAHGWRLSKSVPVVSLNNASMFPHHARVTKWPGHGLLASFRLNYSAQGYSTDKVYLLDLKWSKVVPLFHTSIAKNDGAAEPLSFSLNIDCDSRGVFSPKFSPPRGASLSPDLKCYKANGTWTLSGNSIIFEFYGAVRSTDDSGRLLPVKTWRKKVVLTLQKNGSLKLISGTLPNYTF